MVVIAVNTGDNRAMVVTREWPAVSASSGIFLLHDTNWRLQRPLVIKSVFQQTCFITKFKWILLKIFVQLKTIRKTFNPWLWIIHSYKAAFWLDMVFFPKVIKARKNLYSSGQAPLWFMLRPHFVFHVQACGEIIVIDDFSDILR